MPENSAALDFGWSQNSSPVPGQTEEGSGASGDAFREQSGEPVLEAMPYLTGRAIIFVKMPKVAQHINFSRNERFAARPEKGHGNTNSVFTFFSVIAVTPLKY